jgi:hypothetical protein
MPARFTLVPALCDSLFAMFTAAVPTAVAALPVNDDGSPAELTVFDGPPVGDVPGAYAAVGYSATSAGQAYTASTGLAVDSVYNLSDVGNRVFFENPAVSCELSTWSGDADPGSMSRQRQRTAAVFNAMAEAVQADPTIGGVVARGPAYATITDARCLQDQSSEGCSVTVQFTVTVVGEAWLLYLGVSGS